MQGFMLKTQFDRKIRFNVKVNATVFKCYNANKQAKTLNMLNMGGCYTLSV